MAVGKLIDVFSDLCLERFPDETMFAEGARAYHATPLPQVMVRQILREHAGRGWQIHASDSDYTVIIGDAPAANCAVGRSVGPVPDLRWRYLVMIVNFVARHKAWGRLEPIPVQPATVVDGTVVHGFADVLTVDGQPRHTFMAITTDYVDDRHDLRLVHGVAAP